MFIDLIGHLHWQGLCILHGIIYFIWELNIISKILFYHVFVVINAKKIF